METPIFDTLKKYAEKTPERFHMPGHKGKPLLFGGLGSALVSIDVTELDETDNLAAPAGAIAVAEKKLAEVYSAKKSFIITGGSTLGNLSMIYGLINEGDKIITDRNSHISVFSALTVSGAVPIYIGGGLADGCGALHCPTPDEVMKAADDNPDAKAVFITSPNSFGITAEIAEIAKICKKKQMFLLVDEAHGAHFPFHEKLPPDAISCGADACVQSFHKTLPALTQTAVIHIGNEGITECVEKALRLFQTSSPSYLLTASADWARAYMQEYGHERLTEIIEVLEKYMPLNALNLPYKDITRLCVKCDGRKSEKLLKKRNIVPEMTGRGFAVFIITAADECGEVEALLGAVSDLPVSDYKDRLFGGLEAAMTPKKAFFSKSVRLPREEAVGGISKNAIFRYPPGVPVVAPGEIITHDALRYIEYCETLGDTFSGIDDNIEVAADY